jgi:hypothetical protein
MVIVARIGKGAKPSIVTVKTSITLFLCFRGRRGDFGVRGREESVLALGPFSPPARASPTVLRRCSRCSGVSRCPPSRPSWRLGAGLGVVARSAGVGAEAVRALSRGGRDRPRQRERGGRTHQAAAGEGQAAGQQGARRPPMSANVECKDATPLSMRLPTATKTVVETASAPCFR